MFVPDIGLMFGRPTGCSQLSPFVLSNDMEGRSRSVNLRIWERDTVTNLKTLFRQKPGRNERRSHEIC